MSSSPWVRAVVDCVPWVGQACPALASVGDAVRPG